MKLWEDKFIADQGRKPTKEERKLAPENVSVAFKNLWKIQAYFDQEEKERKSAKEKEESEESLPPQTPLIVEKENLTVVDHLKNSAGAWAEISAKVYIVQEVKSLFTCYRGMSPLYLGPARISPTFLHPTLTLLADPHQQVSIEKVPVCCQILSNFLLWQQPQVISHLAFGEAT